MMCLCMNDVFVFDVFVYEFWLWGVNVPVKAAFVELSNELLSNVKIGEFTLLWLSAGHFII